MILTAHVECANPDCGEVYDGNWEEDSDELADMDGPPVEEQECPACGRRQVETWPGWTFRSEAG